jgi:DNA-binding MarR family transcriptional regulator
VVCYRYHESVQSKEILTALRRIMRAIDLHSKQLEKQAGLTLPQILVLQSVEEAGSLPVSEIARAVSLSQATVTSVLDRLARKNLIRRERNSTDRRKVTVTLTKAGTDKVNDAPGLLQEDFVERFEQLEPWEQKMLIAALERIASLMDAQQVDASPILQVGEILRETPPNRSD